MLQSARKVLRTLHPEAEREVIVSLGELLVGRERFLELLLGRRVAVLEHPLHSLVVGADGARASAARRYRQRIALDRFRARRAKCERRGDRGRCEDGVHPPCRARAAPARSRAARCRPPRSARRSSWRRTSPSLRRVSARPPAARPRRPDSDWAPWRAPPQTPAARPRPCPP